MYGAVTVKNATGNVLPGGSAVGNRFLFTGREWLAQVNLYDYRNRMYSQQLGRFLQVDPITFERRDINFYRYVRNEPISRKDPRGLYSFGPGYGVPGIPNGVPGGGQNGSNCPLCPPGKTPMPYWQAHYRTFRRCITAEADNLRDGFMALPGGFLGLGVGIALDAPNVGAGATLTLGYWGLEAIPVAICSSTECVSTPTVQINPSF